MYSNMHMNDELVSVVVPVYNVERYIRRCVISLIEQDYKNIEIVLVDDGSPDASSQIIDELSEMDDRILALHKPNGGVSSARNAGIEASHGKWVMFVDGDDWVDSDYVSYFLSLVEHDKSAVGFNLANHVEEGAEANSSDSQVSVIPAETAIEWIYSDKIFVAVWNKIYRADLLNVVRFSEDIWYGEGMLFNIEVLQHVDTVAVGNRPVYHQTFNPYSAMRQFNLKSNYCGIASLWLQRSKWIKKNERIELEWRYHLYRFNRSIIDGLGRAGLIEAEHDAFRECVKNIRKDIRFAMRMSHGSKERAAWLLYFLMPKTMSKRSARKFNETRDDLAPHGNGEF